MIKLFLTNRSGVSSEISALPGATLMESIRDAGFDELQATCGGCASCATCHVYVEHIPPNTEYPALSEIEDELLEASFFRTPESRLSCQLRIDASFSGMKVTIAPQD